MAPPKAQTPATTGDAPATDTTRAQLNIKFSASEQKALVSQALQAKCTVQVLVRRKLGLADEIPGAVARKPSGWAV